MLAIDTNVLVYAHRRESPFHPQAAKLLTQLAEGPRTWAIPWPCIYEFFSVVTHQKIYSPPSTSDRAVKQIEAWAESPTLRLLTETAGSLKQLRPLLVATKTTGPRVHDARIACICIAHQVEALVTLDRDFSRFPQLRTQTLPDE